MRYLVKMPYWWQTVGLMVRDRSLLLSNCLALVMVQVAGWVLWFKIDKLPHEVPLWYSAPPIGQLVPVEWLWLLPGVAAGSWLVNLGLAVYFYNRYSGVSQLLGWVAAGVGVMGVIGVVKTVMIFTKLL